MRTGAALAKRDRRVLVIDEATAGLGLQHFLTDHGYTVDTVSTGQAGIERFAGGSFDVAVVDLLLPDMAAFDVLEQIKLHDSAAEVIVITGYGSASGAVDVVKAGAFYFIQRPFEPEGLRALIDRALEHRWAKSEAERLGRILLDRDLYCGLVGRSKPMQDMYELIESVGQSDANILIAGESGTGKELIANAIHMKSARARNNFVKINCAALPKELIENELFGHVKGAFTGADRDKRGLIASARGGSLLLDEIAEMPLELQPKLLRVLQERQYQQLGSEKIVEADFRLIASTNRHPNDALEQGLLREDLYFRIATITIEVPPLRARPDDVQLLADHMLQRHAEKYAKTVTGFTPDAGRALYGYDWPGNVRELESVVERAVLLSRSSTIDVGDLQFNGRRNAGAPGVDADVQGAVGQNGSAASGSAGNGDFHVPFGMPLDEVERRVIEQTMDLTKGNKQAAANALGIYRARLYTMLKKHNVA